MRRPLLATAVLTAGAVIPLLAAEPEIRYVRFTVDSALLPGEGGITAADLTVTDVAGQPAALQDDLLLAVISGDSHVIVRGGPSTLASGTSSARFRVEALPGLVAGSVIPVTVDLGALGSAKDDVVVGTPNGGG